ncbi:Helicase-associated [Balamuthia mandrillaris]
MDGQGTWMTQLPPFLLPQQPRDPSVAMFPQGYPVHLMVGATSASPSPTLPAPQPHQPSHQSSTGGGGGSGAGSRSGSGSGSGSGNGSSFAGWAKAMGDGHHSMPSFPFFPRGDIERGGSGGSGGGAGPGSGSKDGGSNPSAGGQQLSSRNSPNSTALPAPSSLLRLASQAEEAASVQGSAFLQNPPQLPTIGSPLRQQHQQLPHRSQQHPSFSPSSGSGNHMIGEFEPMQMQQALLGKIEMLHSRIDTLHVVIEKRFAELREEFLGGGSGSNLAKQKKQMTQRGQKTRPARKRTKKRHKDKRSPNSIIKVRTNGSPADDQAFSSPSFKLASSPSHFSSSASSSATSSSSSTGYSSDSSSAPSDEDDDEEDYVEEDDEHQSPSQRGRFMSADALAVESMLFVQQGKGASEVRGKMMHQDGGQAATERGFWSSGSGSSSRDYPMKHERSNKRSSSTGVIHSHPTSSSLSSSGEAGAGGANRGRKRRRASSNREKRAEELNQTWERRFEELQAFQAKFGHCTVPKKYMDGKLCNWCHTQRRMKRAGGYREDRAARLEALGFVWDPPPYLTPPSLRASKATKNELEQGERHHLDRPSSVSSSSQASPSSGATSSLSSHEERKLKREKDTAAEPNHRWPSGNPLSITHLVHDS